MALMDALRGAAGSVAQRWDGASKEQRWAVGAVAGATSVYAVLKLASLGSSKGSKPSSWQLTGGSIDAGSVDKEWKNYSASFGEDGTGTGIKDRNQTVQLVDVFYSLVGGWGVHAAGTLACACQRAGGAEQQPGPGRPCPPPPAYPPQVTDIYEWGWGQSFHFSPRLPGKSWEASEVGAGRASLPCLSSGRSQRACRHAWRRHAP